MQRTLPHAHAAGTAAPVSRFALSENQKKVLRGLWPYVWPHDRPDLKRTVALVARPDPHRQAGHRHDALHLQVGDGCAGRRARAASSCRARIVHGSYRRADSGGRLLRRRAHRHGAAGADARRHVRQGRDARGAQAGAQHLRAHAPPVAALPSGAQDGRPDARARARPHRHREHHAHDADDAAADHRRVLAGHRRLRHRIRLALRRSPS